MELNIKKILNNNIVERAIKTFFEGFLGYILIQLKVVIESGNFQLSKTMLEALIMGAVASGLSALINYVLPLLKNDYKVEKVKVKEVK